MITEVQYSANIDVNMTWHNFSKEKPTTNGKYLVITNNCPSHEYHILNWYFKNDVIKEVKKDSPLATLAGYGSKVQIVAEADAFYVVDSTCIATLRDTERPVLWAKLEDEQKLFKKFADTLLRG